MSASSASKVAMSSAPVVMGPPHPRPPKRHLHAVSSVTKVAWSTQPKDTKTPPSVQPMPPMTPMPSAQQPPKAINEKNEKNEKSPATSPIFAVAKAAQIRHEVMIPMEYGIKLLQMSKEETAQANLPFPLMWRLWLGSDIV